jgi:hypothetical protein
MNIHILLEDIVLTSYVISNSKGYWYVVPVDYWVMNHWEQWVFANFDKKEFYTTFGEWALENAVLDSWKGVRAEFKERIPVEEQFWKKSIEA